MAFCKNCGTNIGDAKFCPSCGQCASEASTTPASNTQSSPYRSELQLYSEQSTKMLVFGILSLVFCMGIGLIFEIIALVIATKIKNGFAHAESLTNPDEISTYNAAKSRHKTGATLAATALCITSVLLFVLFMLLIMLLIISL